MMRPIPAIAATTLREAWAFRVYLAILPFIALAAFGLFSSQPSPEYAARYAREVLVVAALICTIPVLLLFVAMSLREERLGRSLSVLLARPVLRLEYIIGRYLGFCLAGLLLLLAMCIVGTVLAKITLPRNLLSARPRYRAAGITTSETAAMTSKGVYLLEGPEDKVTWEFRDLGARERKGFDVVIRPEIYGETRAAVEIETRAGAWLRKSNIELEDNRDTEYRIEPPPGAAPGFSNCSVTVRLREATDIAVGIDTNTDSLGRERHGLHRLGPAEFFMWSYAKTLAYHFANIALAAAVVMLIAGFASAPIAGGFALVVYLTGISVGALRAFLASPVGESTHSHAGHVHPAEGPFPGWFAVAATSVLNFAVTVFPDLGRYEATGAFVSGETMPLAFVLYHAVLLLPYAAGILAVAWFLLMRAEVTE